MYMQSPQANDPHQFDLTRILSSFDRNLSSPQYNQIWQELRHSGKELDDYYEISRSSTFQFKDDYDAIKKTERLNEALRERYYTALATKKKHEEDRDNYFQNEQELLNLKESFLETSQELALANSRYVEYNQRFSQQREKLIVHIIDDASTVNEQNLKLKLDKERLNKELHTARSDLADHKEKVRELENEKEQLNESCKIFEKRRETLKKEGEWLLRQNTKLKESNSRCEKEIQLLNDKIGSVNVDLRDKELSMANLREQYENLSTRFSQQEQLVESLNFQIAHLKEEMDNKDKNWEELQGSMTSQMQEMRRKMEESRRNNHTTILRNQKLREKLKSANQRNDAVTRDKLTAVLKEYKTRKTNQELTLKQLELIGEVLELKEDFFRDQDRIAKGGRVNKKLNKEIDFLKSRVRLFKESPPAIDPLDGAQEYRELTRNKFSQRQLLRSVETQPTTSEEIRPLKSFERKPQNWQKRLEVS